MNECVKRDKTYYKRVATIAIPVTLSFSINVCLGLVDSLMVGRLGVNPLAAVGAGNELFYILGVTVYGLCSGSAVFVAQYWGMRDIYNIRKVFCVNLICMLSFICVCVIVFFIFAPELIWLFSRKTTVIETGTIYIRIVAPSFILSSISQVIGTSSRAVQKLKVVTAVSIAAISMNVLLNYILIYGKLGITAMGVSGAAIATDIARIFEIVTLLIYIYTCKEHPLAISMEDIKGFNKEDAKRILKMSMPVMISEGGWSIANALYYVAYGIIGTSALAASQVVVLAGKICQSFYGGFANSSGILIGEELGKGNVNQAKSDGKIFIKIVIVMGILFTAALYLAAPVIAKWYRFDTETTWMITWGIRVFSAFHLIKMMGYVFVCGILRSGGDTRFCMYVDLGTSWLISIPAVFIGVSVFGINLPMAVGCTYFGEIIKGSICLKRYFSGKWIKMVAGK